MKKLLILIIICFVCTSNVFAKRVGPKEMNPIIKNQIKYTVPHWGDEQNGGYIEAHNNPTNDLLWRLKVYSIKYNENIEGDVQDIFINKIEINNNELTIWNEVNDKFIVDIETKEIIPKNKVYKN